MSRQLRRESSVASRRRGNHASGADSSRPSAKTTTSRSSVTDAVTAVASSLTAEMDIPRLQKAPSLLDHQHPRPVEFMGTKTMRLREADRPADDRHIQQGCTV